MNKFELIIGSILCISILFNIGIFLYARAVVVRLLSISEELGDLQEMVDSFAKHLSLVYEMETFYGDQTITSLMNHMKVIKEDIVNYSKILVLHDDEEETINAPES